MIEKYLRKLLTEMIEMFLCPWTWTGSAAAFLVALNNSTDTQYAKYILFGLFLHSVGIMFWLHFNILNVRGKQI